MKILFLTDNFPPEGNAPASRTYEHCVEWVKSGAEVTVITCAPNFPEGKVFPGYKNKLYQTEMMDGIKVIRVWTYITPNRGMTKRILDYLSFCIMGFLASLFVKTDLIMATSPQLFTALAGYGASIFKGKPWIMEVRDLWPESIKAVEAMRESFILKLIDQLVMFLYRKATRIVVVTDSFKPRIAACGVKKDKIYVVKNGVRLDQFKPLPKDPVLLDQLGLRDKFVLAYIGTHGMAHKLDFILDCAQAVEDPEVHFLFVGAGAMQSRLKRKVKELSLKNVTMLDAIPKEKVAAYISVADVSLINLRKSITFTKVIPSKMFENAAMAKPILLGVEGEAKSIIENYGAGLCFEPENQTDFLEKLQQIKQDHHAYAGYQEGCLNMAKAFDRTVLAYNLYEILEYMLAEPAFSPKEEKAGL